MTVPIAADPNRMRATAASLRSDAELVAGLAAQLQSQVDAMQFSGPAADEFRASTQEQSTQVQQIAGDLGELANQILVSAAQVEQEQQAALLAQSRMSPPAQQGSASPPDPVYTTPDGLVNGFGGVIANGESETPVI